MHWIDRFDLFLFDFDGLLVDTEKLHFKAFREMCHRRGYDLPWNMHEYLGIAHTDPVGLKNSLYKLFPTLFEQEPRWEVLRAEKSLIYEELLEQGQLSLLSGVEQVLETLARLNKKRCVVTNAPLSQVAPIQAQLPILKTIPRWFTRETYALPKPAPDGYLKALSILKSEGDRVIGFEDSLRGLQALQSANVSTAVLICFPTHPQLRSEYKGKKEALYATSFQQLETLFQ